MTSPQKWSRYAYAANDSVNKTDPLGLDCQMDSFGIELGDNYGDVLGDINGPGLDEIDPSILGSLFGTGLCGLGSGAGGNACEQCITNVRIACGKEAKGCYDRNDTWFRQQERKCKGRKDEKACVEGAVVVHTSNFFYCLRVFDACVIHETEKRCSRVCG